LFTDCRVNSYSLVEDSVVLPRVDIGRHCRVRKAIIASGCKLPEELVVGEDSEADAARFHRTEGGVTLITPRMLERLR
jgi:glucose-1-phosphate adenylyltransferase